MSDVQVNPEDELLLEADKYVRSHEIYKSFAASELAGTANGARWLARDAYQTGWNLGNQTGFVDGKETGFFTCGGCNHPWYAHQGECGAYMPDGSICGCTKLIVSDLEELDIEFQAKLRKAKAVIQEAWNLIDKGQEIRAKGSLAKALDEWTEL